MTIPCRVVRRHIDALVDGELETSVQVEFEAHLADCPICRDQAGFSRTVKQTIQSEFGKTKAPEHLRLRLVTALEASPAPEPAATSGDAAEQHGALAPLTTSTARDASGPRVFGIPARYMVPAAAAAVFFVVLGTRSDDDGSTEAIEASAVPLFEDLARRYASEHPTEVEGSPQQVVGWFQGKLEFPVRPVEFGGQPGRAQLIGARISNINGHDAAAFYYLVDGHRVTVMVFEPPREIFEGAETVQVRGRQLHYRQVRGYTVPVVEHDGLGYAFTSDLDSQSMFRLAASASF